MENKKNLMTATEVLIDKGLNWEVEKASIYDAQGRELEKFKAIQRVDTGQTFQVSKNGYTPINNRDSLSLLDEVVGTGYAKYSGAVSYKQGAVVMVRCEVPNMDFDVNGEQLKGYIHVATSHDGSIATTIIASLQRMICRNLLTVKEGQSHFKFKHTKNYQIRVEDAKEAFADYREAFQKQKRVYELLARQQMNILQLDSFLNSLLNFKDKEEENSTRIKNVKGELERLFVDGIGHDKAGIRGTKWAGFNAITEYVDHHRSTKGDSSNREFASMFGSGAVMRDKALVLLTR